MCEMENHTTSRTPTSNAADAEGEIFLSPLNKLLTGSIFMSVISG